MSGLDNMVVALFYAALGYVCGSFLSAKVIPKWLCHVDVTQHTKDANPGAANTFLNAGIFCGIIVLLIDLLKGAVPVYLCARQMNPFSGWFVPAMVAPVAGHAWSCFFGGKGGKAIAVSFGVTLGLLPEWRPLALLAAFYILFSTVLRIPGHVRRSIITFLCWAVSVALVVRVASIAVACFTISGIVIAKHLKSLPDEREEHDALPDEEDVRTAVN